MGAGSSKQDLSSSGRSSRAGNRSESPKEKHNSADSQAPLAEHAAKYARPSISSPDGHTNLQRGAALQHIRMNNTEETIQPLLRRPTVVTPPKATLLGPTSANLNIDNIEGHSNVTRPPPPPRLRQLDELIDPAELPIDCHIRSPSGTMLALEQFLVHPDRPRSIRERQEEIREKVRAASRLGVESGNGEKRAETRDEKVDGGETGAEGDGKVKKKRRCRGCWCFKS